MLEMSGREERRAQGGFPNGFVGGFVGSGCVIDPDGASGCIDVIITSDADGVLRGRPPGLQDFGVDGILGVRGTLGVDGIFGVMGGAGTILACITCGLLGVVTSCSTSLVIAGLVVITRAPSLRRRGSPRVLQSEVGGAGTIGGCVGNEISGTSDDMSADSATIAFGERASGATLLFNAFICFTIFSIRCKRQRCCIMTDASCCAAAHNEAKALAAAIQTLSDASLESACGTSAVDAALLRIPNECCFPNPAKNAEISAIGGMLHDTGSDNGKESNGKGSSTTGGPGSRGCKRRLKSRRTHGSNSQVFGR